jgi:hypothetical protein
MDAESFIETANPPASSAGELMRDPLESRLRLFWRFTLVLLRLYATAEEALFVLILIIVVFLYYLYLRSFRAAFGPLFKVFDLTSWSCSKILLFFYHGEHGRTFFAFSCFLGVINVLVNF